MPWQPPPDYPARLVCNGRAPDPEFAPTERLFCRLPPLQPDEESYDEVPAAKLPPLPISVNREKYSHDDDVIRYYPDYGIAVLRVQDISISVSVKATGKQFELRVEHDPIENEESDNYAHTEIRIYRDEVLVDPQLLDKKERLAIKESISRVARVYKQPARKNRANL